MIELIMIYLILGLGYLAVNLPTLRYAISVREPYYNLSSMVFAIVLTCISSIMLWPYGLYLKWKEK